MHAVLINVRSYCLMYFVPFSHSPTCYFNKFSLYLNSQHVQMSSLISKMPFMSDLSGYKTTK